VITCKEAVDRLWEYLDHNLGQVEGDELDEHLGVCRHCCGELEFGRRLREMLRGWADRPAELAPEVHTRLETFLRDLGERQ
jgi:anti-sigma factor (TIGR02949 family)